MPACSSPEIGPAGQHRRARECPGSAALHVPWYSMHGHKVWGATATILSELEGRLRVVLDD